MRKLISFCLAGVMCAYLPVPRADQSAEAATSSPAVWLGSTRYEGVALESGVTEFRGIPFALPPVGPRRWLPPAALPTSPETFDATRFAPACMQNGSGVAWYHGLMRRVGADPATFPIPEYSEDCLYLNIWSDLNAPSARPVIVYIHGGSNTGGWSYEPNYRGERLAEHGVVLVSVAYRLGVFGFLSHPDLPARNMAIYDLAMALRWIRQHIAAFGGEPNNITLMGESAGAANASHLMVSPLSAGSAKRLIHQSGGWQFDGLANPRTALELGLELERLLVGEAGGLDAMRERTSEEVMRAATAVYSDYYFSPVPDPASLPKALGQLAANDALPPFDLLIGTNADESLMYLEGGETVQDWVRENLAAPTKASVLSKLDPAASERERLNLLNSAQQFACPSMRLASAIARAGGRSFMYRFNRTRRGLGVVGAYHGAELPYVFDTHDSWLPTDPIDHELTAQMIDRWLSFAADGQPAAGAPLWPRWETGQKRTLMLGNEIRIQAFPDSELCHAFADAGV